MKIGDKINRWTIIGEAQARNGRKHYPCRCECGHEQLVRSDNLSSAHSRSHRGCPLKDKPIIENVVEKKWLYKAISSEDNVIIKNSYLGCMFGDWLVVNYDHGDAYGHAFYNCVNSAGDYKVFRYDYLTKTFGFPENSHNPWTVPEIDPNALCFGEYEGSLGEQAIASYLVEHNIPFDREFTFEDLRGNTGLLRFDFKVNYGNQILLIEFQGKQHYQPVQFFGGEERFKIQQIYDEYKRAYCKRNGYKLIEIPYTDLDNVAKYLHFLTF